MTFQMKVLRFSIFAGLFLLPTLFPAQAESPTVYAAGQEAVQICLPATERYSPETCEANFNPVGLCEEGEEVELDHCSTYSDPPRCSNEGQSCACYYFCRKPAEATLPPTDSEKASFETLPILNETQDYVFPCGSYPAHTCTTDNPCPHNF